MSDAPKQIWAFYSPVFGAMWTPRHDEGATEYIRADLVPSWQPIATAPRDGAVVFGMNASLGLRSASVVFWDAEVESWRAYTLDNKKTIAKFPPDFWLPVPIPQVPALAQVEGTDVKEG